MKKKTKWKPRTALKEIIESDFSKAEEVVIASQVKTFEQMTRNEKIDHLQLTLAQESDRRRDLAQENNELNKRIGELSSALTRYEAIVDKLLDS